MRANQVSRYRKILKVSESHKRGLCASRISSRLTVPVCTVYRDFESIHEGGLPVYDRVDKSFYRKLVERSRADIPLPLTTTELMSLHMTQDGYWLFDGTVFEENVEPPFGEGQAFFPLETIRCLENISKRFRAGAALLGDFRAIRDHMAPLSARPRTGSGSRSLQGVIKREKGMRRDAPYQM